MNAAPTTAAEAFRKPEKPAEKPEAGLESTDARQVVEAANKEAQAAYAEFDMLSTYDPDAVTYEQAEVAELKAASDEAKQQVQAAVEALKAEIGLGQAETPRLDEMLAEAKPPQEEPLDRTEDTLMTRAARTVEARGVVEDMEEQKRSELLDKTVASRRKLEELKERKASLERLMENAKRAHEALGEIGMADDRAQGEDLASIEAELKTLEAQVQPAEQAYEALSKEYEDLKLKQKEPREQTQKRPTAKEAAHAMLLTAKRGLENAQKALDTFLKQSPEGQRDETQLEALRKDVDRRRRNVEFSTKMAEVEELNESIAALEAQKGSPEELEALKQTRQTKEAELDILQEGFSAAPSLGETPEQKEARLAEAAEKAMVEGPLTEEEMGKELEAFEAAEAAKKSEEPAHDWESLLTEERIKLNETRGEYERAVRNLENAKAGYPKPWAPIQQKYFEVLEADKLVSEQAVRHAQNQMELYALNKDIEQLSKADPEDSRLDGMIESRNAKDALSHTLAAAYEQAKAKHEGLLQAYTVALERLAPTGMEEGEEAEHEEKAESAGVGPSPLAGRGLYLAPEDRSERPRSLLDTQASPPASQEKKPGFLSRIFGAFRKRVDEDIKTVTFQK